jgi:hypothetical protein
MIVHSHVSFAFLNHYATRAIVQHAMIPYSIKASPSIDLTSYNMSIM